MKCGTVTRSAMTDNFPEIDLDQVEAPVVGPGEPRRTPAIFKNKNEYFFQLKKLKKVASFLESASFLRLSSFLSHSPNSKTKISTEFCLNCQFLNTFLCTDLSLI